MHWIASTAFSLEGQTAKDLRRLGIPNPQPMPTGGVRFEAPPEAAFLANLWLRCADRVLLEVGRFEARSFEQLFEATKALPWADYIPPDGAFPVRAHCARSTLMSPSDCQSIVKKAIVERLKAVHHQDWFREEGATHAVDVSIREDQAIIALDSSGEALNRRGYRTWRGEAPLRETLAAALLLMSPWRPALPLYDPCCGSGTFLIEGAFIALNRAPGLMRGFDCEGWGFMPAPAMKRLRAEAEEAFCQAQGRALCVAGSDIDEKALEVCRRHIEQAGLAGRVEVHRRDLRNVSLAAPPGVILCNPPYGERLGDARLARTLARQLELLRQRSPGWTLCALTGDMGYERHAQRRADKRRRLYNGRLECEFLTFDPTNAPARKEGAR